MSFWWGVTCDSLQLHMTNIFSMKKTTLLTLAAACVVLFGSANTAQALSKKRMKQFTQNIQTVTLVTHHDKLWAIAQKNNTHHVFKSTNGKNWKKIPRNRSSVAALKNAPGSVASDPIVFKDHTYLALNEELTDFTSRVYRVPTTGTPAKWKAASEKGFGGRNIINEMIVTGTGDDARLWAITSGPTGTKLWRTTNGTSWKQITVSGVPTISSAVTSVVAFQADGVNHAYASDVNGYICRARISNLTKNTCVGQFGSYVHDMATAGGKLHMMASVAGTDSIFFYSSNSGESFSNRKSVPRTSFLPRFQEYKSTLLATVPQTNGVTVFTLNKSKNTWKKSLSFKQPMIGNMVEFGGNHYIAATTHMGSTRKAAIFRVR